MDRKSNPNKHFRVPRLCQPCPAFVRGFALLILFGSISAVSARASDDPVSSDDPAPSYSQKIAPIFAARCAACHGETKQKGQLALHAPEAIQRGGKHGPALVAGKPGESALIHRLRLPLDDVDHMPPDDQPQPTPEEIRLLEAWIAAGAPLGEKSSATAVKTGATPAPKSNNPKIKPPEPPVNVAPADAAALARLREQLVHVEAVAQGSPLLWLNFAATARNTTDAEAKALLEPVREQVADLYLGRSKITDDALALLAQMPNLRRLDIRGTAITDAGLAQLKNHPRLEELIVAQTRLTDAAVEHLLAMPALRQLYAWKAGLSAEGLARLRAQRPELTINVGDGATTAKLETEPPLKFTSDAPLPGQPAVASAADALKPINTVCPVSGQPVDPRYLIVFHGRVVGFCCPNCPGQFWAEPAKYEAKLGPPPAAGP